MFLGQFEIEIQDNGSIISCNSPECVFIKMILEFKGEICTLCFDKGNIEILFSFGKSFFEDKDIVVLSSFTTGKSVEEITQQFVIPRAYMDCYPDRKAFVIGMMDAFCVSKEQSNLSELDQTLTDFLSQD